ncbi:MAG: hypothetical protein ACLU37_08545 [Collinsella sp.]
MYECSGSRARDGRCGDLPGWCWRAARVAADDGRRRARIADLKVQPVP